MTTLGYDIVLGSDLTDEAIIARSEAPAQRVLSQAWADRTGNAPHVEQRNIEEIERPASSAAAARKERVLRVTWTEA